MGISAGLLNFFEVFRELERFSFGLIFLKGGKLEVGSGKLPSNVF